MEDGGMTVFPGFFHDGEKLNEIGGIEIHPAMEFRVFQLTIMKRVGVSPDQISTFVVPLDENGKSTLSEDRPAFQVTPRTDFRVVCSLKKHCFFIFLKTSRQSRNRPEMVANGTELADFSTGNTCSSSTSTSGAENLTTLPRNQPAPVPQQNTQAQLADLNARIKFDEIERLRMARVQTKRENYQRAMATGYSDRLNLGPGHVSDRLNLGPGHVSDRLNLGPGYVSDRLNLGPGYVSDPADLNPQMKRDELQGQSQRANLQTQRENYQRAMATGYSDRPNFGPSHVSGRADLNPQMKRDELQGQSQRANLQTQRENYQRAMATGYSDRPNFGPGHVSGRADLNPQMKRDEVQGQSQRASVQNQRENYQTATATATATGYSDRPNLGPGHVSDPNLSLDSFPPLDYSVNSRFQTMKKAKPKKFNCEKCWYAQKNGVPTPFHHCVNDPVVSDSRSRAGPSGRPT